MCNTKMLPKLINVTVRMCTNLTTRLQYIYTIDKAHQNEESESKSSSASSGPDCSICSC